MLVESLMKNLDACVSKNIFIMKIVDQFARG